MGESRSGRRSDRFHDLKRHTGVRSVNGRDSEFTGYPYYHGQSGPMIPLGNSVTYTFLTECLTLQDTGIPTLVSYSDVHLMCGSPYRNLPTPCRVPLVSS